MLVRFRNGAVNLIKHKINFVFLLIVYICLGVCCKLMYKYINTLPSRIIRELSNDVYLFVVLLLFIFITYLFIMILGMPIKAEKIQKDCLKIGLKDKQNNYPMLLNYWKDGNVKYYEFYSESISKESFVDKKNELECELNGHIVDIYTEKDKRHIIVKTISSDNTLPNELEWDENLLSDKEFVLKLGKSILQEESINISSTPHILIGGSTGSGKSVLCKSLLAQCIMKDADVLIADFKGGLDYSKVWHDKTTIITNIDSFNKILDEVLIKLEKRKEVLVDSMNRNIVEYNEKHSEKINHIVICCDEVAEVLDKTGLSKEEKEKVLKVESSLSTIARLGRAFGIHLVLSTQRPDAEILKGQIKNNLGIRICGRADKVLSQIILDNSEAVDKIRPNDVGVFVSNFVSGDGVFKAYMIEDSFLE